MRLFYLSEHRSCFNYQLRYESGFSRYELTAHEEGRIDNDGCFCVLFVLKGEVQVGLGREHTISVHANRMVSNTKGKCIYFILKSLFEIMNV